MNNPQMGGYGNYVPGAGMGAAALPKVGFWMRLLAYIIDAIVLGIVGSILSAILDPSVAYVAGLVVWVAYLIGTSSAFNGATLGKKILGMRVVTVDGAVPDVKTLVLRYLLGYLVSAFILYIGFIMIGFDANKQGLHDKIARTYVVRG